MNWDELKNRPVVSVAGAEKLGHLSDMLLDNSGSRILGFRVRSGGLLTHYQGVLAADIQSFGPDAVTVQDASRLNRESAFSSFGDALTASSVEGSRVMTEGGTELGKVKDIALDLDGLAVTGYSLGVNLIERIRGGEKVVPIAAVHSIGPDLVVVDDSAEEQSGDDAEK